MLLVCVCPDLYKLICLQPLNRLEFVRQTRHLSESALLCFVQVSMSSSTAASDGPLYHLVQEPLWQQCKDSNTPYCPPTYEADGFIHLTKEPNLLLGVANHFYKSVQEDFLVLVIDSNKLTSKVVFEAAAPVGNTPPSEQAAQQLFPHLYGHLNIDAVTAELAVQRDADGTFLSIAGLPQQ